MKMHLTKPEKIKITLFIKSFCFIQKAKKEKAEFLVLCGKTPQFVVCNGFQAWNQVTKTIITRRNTDFSGLEFVLLVLCALVAKI